MATLLSAVIIGVVVLWLLTTALRPLQRTNRTALSVILWTIVAALVVFWFVGLLLVDLGQVVWIALAVAVAVALAEILSRRQRTPV